NVFVLTSNGGNSTNNLSGTGAFVPVASFSAAPLIGPWPLTVSFTDSSTGTITNRFWDFGDGSTSNTAASSLSHTYSQAGTNTVSLTVSGPVGTNTLSKVGYVVVSNPQP